MKTKSLIIANALSNLEDFAKDGTIETNSFTFNKSNLHVSINVEDNLIETTLREMLKTVKGIQVSDLIKRSNDRLSTLSDAISAFITSIRPDKVPKSAVEIYDSLREDPSLYLYENFIQYEDLPIRDKLRECREYPYLMVINNDVYKLPKGLYKSMSYYSLKDNRKEVVNKIADNLQAVEFVKLGDDDFKTKYFTDNSFATRVVQNYYDVPNVTPE